MDNRDQLHYLRENTPQGLSTALQGSAQSTTGAQSKQKKPRKRAHYLRHSQRCAIIERISAGEQQVALAREFNVTRAAVSYMYKNRKEILARDFEEESEEEEEEEVEEDLFENSTMNAAVTEICDNAVMVLLTTLRNPRTEDPAFYRAAKRLMTILIEESVALIGTRAIVGVGAGGETYTGLERLHPFCGITLSAEALPFAMVFSEIELNAPVGSIIAEEVFGNSVQWRIRHMDVPANITDYKILLFTFLCCDTGVECKTVEAFQALGIHEKDIAILAFLSSGRGLNMLTNHFPEIRIITAVIDEQVPAGPLDVFPGLAVFVERCQAEASGTRSPW